MIYQTATLYGEKKKKLLIAEALGVPDTLFALDDEAKLKPHIAIVADQVYQWSVSLQSWELLVPFTSYKNQYPLAAGETDITLAPSDYLVTDFLIKVFAPEAAAKIGLVSGGDQILEESALLADKWYPILKRVVVDAVAVHIYVNIVGTGTLIIYKNKI